MCNLESFLTLLFLGTEIFLVFIMHKKLHFYIICHEKSASSFTPRITADFLEVTNSSFFISRENNLQLIQLFSVNTVELISLSFRPVQIKEIFTAVMSERMILFLHCMLTTGLPQV